MKKDVLVAGLLGGAVMLVWLFATNAVLPIKSNLIHKVIPLANQLEIHEVLKDNITQSGTYSVPYLSPQEEAQLADYRNQPVYSITYEGYTHSGSGGGTVMSSFPVTLLALFIPPLIAAWMLSVASAAILSKFSRRFFFVAVLGVIVALYDDVLQMAFGPQPKDYLTFLAINNVLAWALTGLVIARMIRPAKT